MVCLLKTSRNSLENTMKNNQLAIGLITFNRAECVRKTLEAFFCPTSPVRRTRFYVFDNCSTDGTASVVKSYAKKNPSIVYVRNGHNIGPNANIVRAIEHISLSGAQYGWVIGDDDLYDFSHWNQVVSAFKNQEKVICCARYKIPDDKVNDVAKQLLQLNFLGGLIFSTQLIRGDVMRCVYDSIYTMFPHMIPVVHHINEGGHICVLKDAIVRNGWCEESDVSKRNDVSYIRGVTNPENYNPKIVSMRWATGWAELCNCINDDELRRQAFSAGVISDCITYENYLAWMRYFFKSSRYKSNVAECLGVVSNEEFKGLLEIINDVPRCEPKISKFPASYVACPGRIRYKWWTVTRDQGGMLTFWQLGLLLLRRVYLRIFKPYCIPAKIGGRV